MLQDFLVRDPASLDELAVTDDDHKAILASQDTKALQAILKFCISRIIAAENELFESEVRPDEAGIEGLIQARKAYRAVAWLILHPDAEPEEEAENE